MKQFVVFFACFAVVVGGRFSANGQTVINYRLPGISCLSEIQTNPPQRLFIATVDLTSSRVHLRVAPAGPDPDGPGEWETTLLQPTRIAGREHFALVVNGDFFNAKNVRDAEGAKA